MKVLVTGAGGFVGKEVCKKLRQKGHKVYGTDITRKPGLDYLDVTQLGPMIEYLKKHRFGPSDGVIHLAAKVAGKPSLKDPWGYFYVNFIGTLNILEAMKVRKVKHLVFASSWSTYGSKIALPITEATPQHPENPYGASKKACEALVESYTGLFPIQAVILRPTMIYGPNQPEKNVLQQVVDAMVTGKKFEIYGKGTHTREFLNVRDAATVFARGIEVAKKIETFEIFILGTEDPIKIADLAKMGKRIKDFPLVFKNVPTWAFSQRSSMSKLKRAFEIDTKNFVSLEEGLVDCLKSRKPSSSGK